MYSPYSHKRKRIYSTTDRFQALFFVAVFIFLLIGVRLFQVQVLHGNDYEVLAEEQNSRGVVLPAKRGNIYAKDYRTSELFPLAQNSTTYIIFADPLLIEEGKETQVVDSLLPFLYMSEGSEESESEDDVGPKVAEDETQNNNEEETKKSLSPKIEFRNDLVDKLATKNVVRRELYDVGLEELKLAQEARLPGIGVDGEILTINPTLIDDPEDTATKLATILEADYDSIYPLMLRKKVRYVKLASRVSPSLKDKIVELGIRGVGAIPEYRRVYPESNLAAQVVGFLDHDENGVYGIEGALDKKLKGKDGLRRTQVDPFNRQITVGDVLIENAVDGDSIVLTIDRAIQSIVEKALTKMVLDQRADSGQAIVMDPHTGAILALAHSPAFNPNDYGDVYQTEALIHKETKEKKVDADGNVYEEVEDWWETPEGEKAVTEWGVEYVVRGGFRYPVFSEYENGEIVKKSIYLNRLGEGVFALKGATEPYEPGSVFKPIVMAMALDAGEVTPQTRSPYNGPVELDEKLRGRNIVIKNAEGTYHGQETMTEVIENSSNIGMTFVAQQLGRATFYDYLKKFGFGERSEVEFEGEDTGGFENYTKWSDSELITKAFGQGLTVNLFQMAAAYSALANGGLLMKPYVVDEEIYPDGRKIKTEPETIRRVIDKETSQTITQMLISSVHNGLAKAGGVDGYFVAGKTGTSQTYLHGRALNDLGTTIAAFGGYAPATDPKFVLLVKIDRPRVSEWGTSTAAPVFKSICEELLTNYFAIPPK